MTGSSEQGRPSKNRIQAYAWAVVGGVICFVGWAGFGYWPLTLISTGFMWAALELSVDRPWQSALGVSWVYGIVAIAGGYHWLVPFFEVFSGYGSLASIGFWVAFSVYLGGQWGVCGVIYWFVRRRGWSVAVAAIPPFIAAEWLYPKLFPIYMSNAFSLQAPFVQIAELGGPLLITAVVLTVNLWAFEMWRWWRGKRGAPRKVAAVALVSVGLTLTYGLIRIPQIEARMEAAPWLRLGVVQVNMGIFEKRTDAIEGHRRHLAQSMELEEAGELDLLVWPESAYTRSLSRELPISASAVRRSLDTPVLFGGVSEEIVDGERKIYNTAFLTDAEGIVRSTYDKTYLLMFGEYLPFGETFPILYELSPNSGRFTAGTHVRPLTLGPWRISTPICYEDVLPAFTRKMVREANPHILINLTNDSWFGDTQEPWIHLVLAQFRAIEHRRYLVRSTNSGISAVIDPLGRIVAQTGLLTRENIRYDVAMLQGTTFYGRFGDWPGWLSLVAIAGIVIRRRDPVK